MVSTDDIADQPPGFAGQKLARRVALVTGGTRGSAPRSAASLASQEAVMAAE